MIVYDTPSSEGCVHMRITEAEAIQRSKDAAAQKGLAYPNDNEALEDFLVIHWAWREP